ncbi:MAG: hypothetical protein COX77_03170 [Candidatus Komeilibacteria bacterium CG_4_10_14_0_2_um_filter_37_10]|uniref:HAD family hydrolase n=1 Tax=Candidatus Komeilibacteria bacterium CG_4_10_14_0_2_um_filter_37_10 TaxID=1974470 RepID=A0A2M7VEE6_9BACT|nr:MAG: hypothetical protein COX77_03170 [Candidatus Komeilibacteria bacterium CG_4_10_14_0_2_um_filter_37_10]
MTSKLAVDEYQIRSEFKKLLQPFARADLTAAEFLQQFIGSLDQTVNPQLFFYLFNDIIPAINYDLLNYIQKLHQQYTTYLLSNNFGSVFPNYEKQIQFDVYFNKLFLSHQLGVSKTQTEIWDKILPQIEFLPSELVFIDNQEKYFAPVSKFGIKTILYLNNKQVKKDLAQQGVTID